MYHTYENQLQLDFNKSALCYLYLLITTILVVFSLLLLSFDFYLKLLVIALVLFSTGYFARRRSQIISMKWLKGNRWLILSVRDSKQEAVLLNSSFISRFICVLNFKLDSGGKISYTVFADSLDHEQMRRLLVRFKIEQTKLFSK